MWHSMFAEQVPLAEKILRTVIVYALIVVLFRLTGKRGLASMSIAKLRPVIVPPRSRAARVAIRTGHGRPGPVARPSQLGDLLLSASLWLSLKS